MFKAPGLGAPRRRAARCAHALPPQACPPAPRRRLSGPHAVVPLPLAIGIALRQLAPVQSYRSIQHKDGDYKHQRTAHCPALRRASTLESRLTLLRRSAVRSFIVHASTQSSGSQSSTCNQSCMSFRRSRSCGSRRGVQGERRAARSCLCVAWGRRPHAPASTGTCVSRTGRGPICADSVENKQWKKRFVPIRTVVRVLHAARSVH